MFEASRRRRNGCLAALLLFAWGAGLSADTAGRPSRKPSTPPGYAIAFSTYLGGSDNDHMGDMATDALGNLYVTGWTRSRDFPTTRGAFDRTFNGVNDGYVAKFTRIGRLVWATLLGGPGNDMTWSIAVDGRGHAYVAGWAGPDFSTTRAAFQPRFDGYNYHGRTINAVVAKLKTDGSGLVWASYFGTSHRIRDLDIDGEGNVYVSSTFGPPDVHGKPLPAEWFADAFQKTPRGSMDGVYAKIAADGSHVIWATYLGGSDRDGGTSVAVDAQGHVYAYSSTSSSDFPTPHGFDTTLDGSHDACLAKLSPDGSRLIWATFLGGSGKDHGASKHGVVVGDDGHVYVAGDTLSRNFSVTDGAFQKNNSGGLSGAWEEMGDWFVARFAPDGKLLAATCVGGARRDSG